MVELLLRRRLYDVTSKIIENNSEEINELVREGYINELLTKLYHEVKEKL